MNRILVPTSAIIKYGSALPEWLWDNVWDSDWRWGDVDVLGQFMNLSREEDAILFRLRFGL